jgi:hypothetical protein
VRWGGRLWGGVSAALQDMTLLPCHPLAQVCVFFKGGGAVLTQSCILVISVATQQRLRV